MSPAAPNKAIRLQQAQEAIGRIKVTAMNVSFMLLASGVACIKGLKNLK